MSGLLFLFGLVVFGGSLVFFIMNFVGENDGLVFISTLFGMLNASIAMGGAEIIKLQKSRSVE
ncbi:MAG: hypothetical protein ACQEV7_01690 [Bacillota bacterium]